MKTPGQGCFFLNLTEGIRKFSFYARCLIFTITLTVFWINHNLALAQEEDIPYYELDSLVITASGIPAYLSEIAQSVTVITREEIDTLPAKSIPDLLEYVSSVDIRQRGMSGIQADLGIRGSTFEQTLVLVDGINMSDPQTGHHNMDLPVNLEDVERIEIVKGPGARLYSHNAMAGVINIITRETEDNTAGGRIKYGQYDYYGIGAYGAIKTGDLSNRLSLSRASSEGHLEGKTDFDINTLFYRGLIRGERQKFRIGIGYTDKDFGAYKFYSDVYPDERESTDTLLAYCSAHLQVSGLEIMPKLFWRQHNDDFRIQIKDNWLRNTHRKDTLGTEFNSQFTSGLGTTAVGFEIVHEAVESSNLGDHDRERNGVFLEHSCKPFKRLTIGLGSSAMKYSGRDWEYWPNAGLNMLLTDRLNWFVSLARSFRVPTYTELYYKDPANQGNPDLRPEKSWTYETGIRWRREAFYTDFSLFLRNSKDLIDWSRVGPPDPWKARNISKIITQGFEVSTCFDPGIYWDNTFVKTLEISYTYLDSDMDTYGLESKYVLDCLKNQIHGSVILDWSGNINQTVKARYERRMTGDGHFIVDSQLTYGWSGYEFFLEATNIFDENYIDSGFSPAPGFWMIGGIKFNKDF